MWIRDRIMTNVRLVEIVDVLALLLEILNSGNGKSYRWETSILFKDLRQVESN